MSTRFPCPKRVSRMLGTCKEMYHITYNRMSGVVISIILAQITYLSMFLEFCPEVIPRSLACLSRAHTALHVKANITVLIRRAIPIGKKNQRLFDSISNQKYRLVVGCNILNTLKFIYSEKATKFCEIFH